MHTTTYSQRTLKAFLAGKQKQKERKIKKKKIDRLVDTCDACSCSICYPVVSSERYAHFFYRSELHYKTEGGGGGGEAGAGGKFFHVAFPPAIVLPGKNPL